MKQPNNRIEKQFFRTYRIGEPNQVKFINVEVGFLRLEYGLSDDPQELSLVSHVTKKSRSAIAVGPRLEFDLQPGSKEGQVTFITENGISGLQWSSGRVFWGHTYDDDSPPEKGRKIGLEQWIDECISKMINPTPEE